MLKVEIKERCPKAGFIILTNYQGRSFVMGTKCKTWRCIVCRKSVLSYVKMRMEYGCLTLGRFYLITVTFQAESESAKDAAHVRARWEQLIRFLKQRSPNLTWMKIVELTKKGVPHLHLLVGGVGKRTDSCAPKGYEFKFNVHTIHQRCAKDCLIHEWSRAWYAVTGDSFVVHARKGYSPARLANYLGKYLVKGFYQREDLKEMGFERRWSCARNWPRPEKLETITSANGGWAKTQIVSGYGLRDQMAERVERDKDAGALQRVGDQKVLDIQKEKVEAGARRRLDKQLKSIGGNNVG